MPLTRPTASKLGAAANPDVLKVFVTKDFPINLTNKQIGYDGWSPLHDAVARQDEAKVDSLLAAGMSCNAGTNNGWTAAHVAGQIGNPAIAEKVFAKADMKGNTVGINPFHMSALSGNAQVMEAAAKKLPFSPESGNNDGWNAMHYAAYAGQVSAMEYLATECPIILERGNKDGWSAAHIAGAMGNVQAIECLLSKGVNQTVGNSAGCRIAHVAAFYDKPAVLQLVMGQGVWDKNTEDTGPLHIAVSSDVTGNHLGEVELMVRELGKSVAEEDKNGSTPLNLAVYGSHKELTTWFLSKEVDKDHAFAKLIIDTADVPQDMKDIALACIGDDALAIDA